MGTVDPSQLLGPPPGGFPLPSTPLIEPASGLLLPAIRKVSEVWGRLSPAVQNVLIFAYAGALNTTPDNARQVIERRLDFFQPGGTFSPANIAGFG